MRIRVGLLGLGDAWDTRHRPALRALCDRFEVRAVCEPVSRRAELAAADFGATAVDGFQSLVRREDLDAILILASGWYGALPILAACEAGKAVYLGALLDLAADHARQIVEQAVRSHRQGRRIDTAEEFVNRIMLGECPECGRSLEKDSPACACREEDE